LYAFTLLAIDLLFLNKFFSVVGDSVVYINLAENVAHGKGFVTDIAFSYVSGTLPQPVSWWQPLYPLVISFPIRMGLDSTFSAMLVSILFLGLIPFPLFYLTRHLYGRKVAHATALYTLFFLPLIRRGAYAYTESMFIFFLLLSLLLLSKSIIPYGGKRCSPLLFASGICIGLAYLTRGNGLLLVPVALFGIFFLIDTASTQLKRKIELSLVLLMGFGLVTSPWLVRNYLIFGNPFHYGQSFLFRSPSFWSSVGILYRIGLDLFPLALLIPYSFKKILKSDSNPKKFLLTISYPLLNVLLFSSWGVYGTRLLSTAYPLLILVGIKALFDLLEKTRRRFKTANRVSPNALIAISLLVVIVPQLLVGFHYYLYGVPYPIGKQPEKGPGMQPSTDWIQANLGEDEIILTNVWDVHYYTDRRVVWIGEWAMNAPFNQSTLTEIIDRFNIKYLILYKRDRESMGEVMYSLAGGNAPRNFAIVYDGSDAIIYRIDGGG